jgi:hypothetical protein
MDAADCIKDNMLRQGLADALLHFERAEEAFATRQWESANSQVRTYIDALFEGVLAVRLGQSARGGEARKKLESERILVDPDAAVVRAVTRHAQQHGSHVGASDETDAAIHRHLGFAVALMGLRLIPPVVRLQDVIKVLDFPNQEVPTDRDCRTKCPTCGRWQNLAEGSITRLGELTVYTCAGGCQKILVIGAPEGQPWPGRGYRIGEHVLRNAADILIPVGESGITIPASPASLMT